MPARSNALSELTRFWLEWRHGCLLREAVPVPVFRGQSDIDFLAVQAKGAKIKLPSGAEIGPRIMVETKDEHDYDPKGSEFARMLAADLDRMQGCLGIPEQAKDIKFSMLRQEQYKKAAEVFGSADFDRLFVLHALDLRVVEDHVRSAAEKRICFLAVTELLKDLLTWYNNHERPAGLRHCLVGDMFHLLFGYCRDTITECLHDRQD